MTRTLSNVEMVKATAHIPSNNSDGFGALTGSTFGFGAVDVARSGWFEGGKILA